MCERHNHQLLLCTRFGDWSVGLFVGEDERGELVARLTGVDDHDLTPTEYPAVVPIENGGVWVDDPRPLYCPVCGGWVPIEGDGLHDIAQSWASFDGTFIASSSTVPLGRRELFVSACYRRR